MKYELREVMLDGMPVWKLRCPECFVWCYLDDEQYRGQVSVACPTPDCRFHRTIDFSALETSP